MQDKFVGDIGDYVKYALLRAIRGERRLGVAWYRHLDTLGNAGKHTEYLDDPEKWRHLDPCLFDALKGLVDSCTRSVQAVMDTEILGPMDKTDYSSSLLEFEANTSSIERAAWRKCWFASVTSELAKSDLVFADPDNGLIRDERFSPGNARQLHGIPLCEAKALTAAGRATTSVIYQHNTPWKGGHLLEIRYWMGLLTGCTHAFYFRPWNPRTFFVVNPDKAMRDRLIKFGQRWSEHGCLLDCKGHHCLVVHRAGEKCIMTR